jgi:hexosaminidase
VLRQGACGVIVGVLALVSCARAPKPHAPQAQTPSAAALPALVPLPVLVEIGPGQYFTITPTTVILANADPAVRRIAADLAERIRRATGITPDMPAVWADLFAGPVVELVVQPDAAALGDEGYDLSIGANLVSVKARTPAGLFYGVQTLRQLLPYWGEYEAVMFRQPRPATLPAVHIRDAPRYPWRGAMLDVARHFFSVDEVKRYVDLLALHKMNRLHLHLSDDQGWRIEIRTWPALTERGARFLRRVEL